jgi:8-oxo-dGTP pyrophosphatase MutT (NUDIX family)
VTREIAAGLLRRGSDVLMVQQEAPTGPAWTVPAGRVEPGEAPEAALVREVREETSVTVLDPGAVAFIVEVDDRREDWAATIWTWAVAAWEGEVAPDDPEILDARWMPLAEAVDHLDGLSWHSSRLGRCAASSSRVRDGVASSTSTAGST